MLHCLVSDMSVWPQKGVQEPYSMTENETMGSEKHTQKVVCFSPVENSFSFLCLRLPLFAVKYAAIKLTDSFSYEYFPLQQMIFKLSLVIYSTLSETQSTNTSMQEKYIFPFRATAP